MNICKYWPGCILILGVISKAKEGLAKSKSRLDMKQQPNDSNSNKGVSLEVKKSDNELEAQRHWEFLVFDTILICLFMRIFARNGYNDYCTTFYVKTNFIFIDQQFATTSGNLWYVHEILLQTYGMIFG